MRDIGEYFNSPYSHEVGRDVVKFKEDKNLVAKDFVYNIYEQNKLNGQMIASMNNNGVFISDTDNLVTLMYAKDYALKEDFSLTIDDYETILLPLAKMYARSIKWNKIYLLKPHEKFIDDGIRCLANSSYESRLKLYNILVDLLKDFNYEYEVLERTYEENFLKVKEYINKYMEGKYEN